eukprot:579857-Pleurochrysis_carterae.AAC.1
MSGDSAHAAAGGRCAAAKRRRPSGEGRASVACGRQWLACFAWVRCRSAAVLCGRVVSICRRSACMPATSSGKKAP